MVAGSWPSCGQALFAYEGGVRLPENSRLRAFFSCGPVVLFYDETGPHVILSLYFLIVRAGKRETEMEISVYSYPVVQ